MRVDDNWAGLIVMISEVHQHCLKHLMWHTMMTSNMLSLTVTALLSDSHVLWSSQAGYVSVTGVCMFQKLLALVR
jgi:hypothetical protein